MADSNGQSPLTIGEFTRWTDTLDRRLDAFHDNMLAIVERQQNHGERIAVVEADVENVSHAAATSGRNHGSMWGALGGLIGGILAGLGFKIGG